MGIADEFEVLKNSPGYDQEKIRLIPRAGKINSLPIKFASQDEIDEAKKSLFFNPVNIYPEGCDMKYGEQGHDLYFRYVKKEKNDVAF